MNRLLSHLRIADLELFMTAAHLKNLGKAASFHHLSQSAASAAIVRVEAAFGRPLCTHEKRQFRLTPEGIALVSKAEQWLKNFRDIIAVDTPRPIRVATTHAIARVAIPAILSVEVGAGAFQLYSTGAEIPKTPVILPENQVEVLSLMQRWEQLYQKRLEVKARIPSWSLIADICACSQEVGFLPDFLAQKVGLRSVSWQPKPSPYRILALHRPSGEAFQTRLHRFINHCREIFTGV